MARAIYSTLFGVGNRTTAGLVSVYTVPAGSVAVVRDVALLVLNIGDQINFLDFTNTVNIANYRAATSPQTFQWAGHQVFPAGAQIGVNCVNAGFNSWRISGYLLTA